MSPLLANLQLAGGSRANEVLKSRLLNYGLTNLAVVGNRG